MQRHLIAFAIIMHMTSVLASNQHLICKSVDDVFSGENAEHRRAGNATAPVAGQGRPGKRGPVGPPGLPGSQGAKGDEGDVDYNNISATIERKVCEGLNAVLSRLTAMQEDISNLQFGQNEIMCSITNSLLYDGTCYSTPDYSSSRHLTREAARLSCNNIGYKLAKIQDRKHQEALENFVRPRVPSTEIYFWIDFTYDLATNSLQYESGETVQHGQIIWYPNYPTSTAGHQYIMLAARKSGNDGIFNHPGSYQAHGVFCEKKL